MPEPYATRVNTDGSRTRYMTRAEYNAARFQATGAAAAQRARINRSIGGRVV